MKIYHIITLSLCLLCTVCFAQIQTGIKGLVTEEETGDLTFGASVKLIQNNKFLRGTVTDLDGKYSFAVPAGTYDIEVAFTGLATSKISGIVVITGQITTVDAKLKSGAILQEVVIVQHKIPLIQKDHTSCGQTITSSQLQSVPTRSAGTSSRRKRKKRAQIPWLQHQLPLPQL